MRPEPGGQSKFQQLLEAERRLQAIIPRAVLVGGTAACLHAGHRESFDGDHVLSDLKDRFPEVLDRLEAEPGWKTARVQRPVLILGELDGFMTGLRQIRRSRALEVEVVSGLLVPTLPEMARVKGWLLVSRDTTRDYLDTVVLLEELGEAGLKSAFSQFDAIYGKKSGGDSPLLELSERLASARPGDRESVDLRSYKAVKPPWGDWAHLQERGRFWAEKLAKLLMEP